MFKSRPALTAYRISTVRKGAIALTTLMLATSFAVPSAIAKGAASSKDKAAAVESSSWTDYKKDLETEVIGKWFPPTGQEVYKSVVVEFRVRNDGKLSKTDFVKATGIPDVDKSAMQAVITAAPFKSFPADANKRDFAKFEITFDKAKLDRKQSVMREL